MKVVLLSARTLRALAYSVVLNRHRQLKLSIVEYGSSELPKRSFPDRSSQQWEPLPDWLRVNWESSYKMLCDNCGFSTVREDLDSSVLRDTLINETPDLVIYAGAAGNLVPDSLLAIAPFVHIHPGQVPEFRGSTTIYWSLLNGNFVDVSAIYLTSAIDQGALIKCAQVPNPSAHSDVDGTYDAGIRALLLDSILKGLDKPPMAQVQPSGGNDYYVIHPVLKNVVLWNIASQSAEENHVN